MDQQQIDEVNDYDGSLGECPYCGNTLGAFSEVSDNDGYHWECPKYNSDEDE